jgi:hypothetical protein
MRGFPFFRKRRRTFSDGSAAAGEPSRDAQPQFERMKGAAMSGDLHAPREALTRQTLHMHYAISSLMEELEAVDWYRQRADDTEDPELRAILLHNMREEIEHACMAIEWLRRNDETFDKELKTYLFKEGDICKLEEIAMGRGKK